MVHARGATTFANYTWVLDAADRITPFTSSDGTSSYTYDANSNRTNTGYQTSSTNSMLSDGTYNYEYDHEGNRTKSIHVGSGQVIERELGEETGLYFSRARYYDSAVGLNIVTL